MTKSFDTYLPNLLVNNGEHPLVHNGVCYVTRFRVTIEEVEETPEVLKERLLDLWVRRKELGLTHMSNIAAMREKAKLLGLELP